MTRTVSPQTLRSWIDADDQPVVVLDVRSAAEFETVHIPGSYNVPLGLLAEHTHDVADRLGQRTVVVCQSGVRAEQGRQRLESSGAGGVSVLEGGVAAYEKAGGEVVRGASRWSMERQVRMAAGSLVLTGLVGGRFVSPRLRTVAGVIGAGLTFSAASNTCAMASVLQRMPWNRAHHEPTAAQALQALPAADAPAHRA